MRSSQNLVEFLKTINYNTVTCFLLQIKEYRSRCKDLETRSTDNIKAREEADREIETLNLALSTLEEKLRASEAQHTFDLETALIKLEDEQRR